MAKVGRLTENSKWLTPIQDAYIHFRMSNQDSFNQHSFNLEQILFLDIETVPIFKTVEELPEDLRDLFLESSSGKKKKAKKSKSEDSDAQSEIEEQEETFGGTGLNAEFGKVICISLGRYDGGITDDHFKPFSIFSHNEVEILTDLTKVLSKYSDFKLCAHNGKEFDFPFLGKRYLINGLPLPSQLNLMGKKPWEVPHIDTMELWAFGAKQNNKTKLKLLCAIFGIPSPKDDIDGSQVAPVYYNDQDLERIARYCDKDVAVLAKVFRKMVGR